MLFVPPDQSLLFLSRVGSGRSSSIGFIGSSKVEATSLSLFLVFGQQSMNTWSYFQRRGPRWNFMPSFSIPYLTLKGLSQTKNRYTVVRWLRIVPMKVSDDIMGEGNLSEKYGRSSFWANLTWANYLGFERVLIWAKCSWAKLKIHQFLICWL